MRVAVPVGPVSGGSGIVVVGAGGAVVVVVGAGVDVVVVVVGGALVVVLVGVVELVVVVAAVVVVTGGVTDSVVVGVSGGADSVALLQQALSGSCDHYPLLLHGIWRQYLLAESLAIEPRLAAESAALLAANRSYQQALEALPIDLAHQGSERGNAWGRLRSTLPLVSPFALVQRIQADLQPDPSRPGSAGSG